MFQIASWGEIEKLQSLENLEEVLFVGNPIFESTGKEQTVLKSEWRIEVKNKPFSHLSVLCVFIYLIGGCVILCVILFSIKVERVEMAFVIPLGTQPEYSLNTACAVNVYWIWMFTECSLNIC
jgi:hypothetical protein